MRKSELLARIVALEALVAKQADQIKALSTPVMGPSPYLLEPLFTPPKWGPRDSAIAVAPGVFMEPIMPVKLDLDLEAKIAPRIHEIYE